MLLVDGLTAHLESLGNRLPGPSLLARVGNLDDFESFEQSSQRPNGPQTLRWIGAACGGGE